MIPLWARYLRGLRAAIFVGLEGQDLGFSPGAAFILSVAVWAAFVSVSHGSN